jgi:hypothetical protein
VEPVRKAQSPPVLRPGWRLRFLAGLSKKLRSSLLAWSASWPYGTVAATEDRVPCFPSIRLPYF